MGWPEAVVPQRMTVRLNAPPTYGIPLFNPLHRHAFSPSPDDPSRSQCCVWGCWGWYDDPRHR